MTTPYAYTRRIDAGTGALRYSGATTTFVESDGPALELVARLLRTPLGTCQADPTWGVDWSRVEKMKDTAARDAQAAIETAMKLLSRPGYVSGVVVQAEARDGAVLYQVDFTDPRTRTRQSLPGVVP